MVTSERIPRPRARAALSGRPSVAVDDLDVGPAVPRVLRYTAAVGWRLLVVAATLYVIGIVFGYLAEVVIPIAIALLLAALLAPAVRWLHLRGVPRALATALVVIGGLAVLGAVLTFVIATFVRGAPALGAQLTTSINAVVNWLTTGPLHLSEQQLRNMQDGVLAALSANQESITTGAINTAATIGRLVAEILLTVFTLVFFLHGGNGIWHFLLRVVPGGVRTRVDVAGRRGLAALVSYTRATAVVAVVDAVAIGIGLAVLRVPLAVPLAALVFLGAFIPIIGAVVAGGVAVLIALAANGPISALIVLAIIIAVMQLEGHVLQPLLLGRAVKLHPLAVAIAIASGLLLAGIPGALLAVPLLAVLNSGIRSLLSEADEHVDPDAVSTSEPEDSGPAEPGLVREPELALDDEEGDRENLPHEPTNPLSNR
jgi:predicted PurR-regulated permease PerM